MASLNVEALARDMLTAAQIVFADKWPEVKQFAESESKKFAKNIEEILAWKLSGQINEEQAKALIRLHQRSMKMVFTALEGIGLAMAEKAVNAALDQIRKTVNKAVGWIIL